MTVTHASEISLGRIEAALRGRKRSDVLRTAPARTAAVYVLFSSEGNDPAVTLIRRSERVTQHRGEYAFPGGGVEPTDRSFHETALREVEEEIGISSSAIEPWGELEPETTVTSGFLVVPFTGRVPDAVTYYPAPEEVAEVIRVPVASLADAANRRSITRLLPASGGDAGDSRRIGAYAYNGRIIWGATARILAQVVDLVRPN
jgi:8-oxo-dGTP pyrophosphatase MutT (NUDIX family)